MAPQSSPNEYIILIKVVGLFGVLSNLYEMRKIRLIIFLIAIYIIVPDFSKPPTSISDLH
jgi:hypothetical protein